MPHSSPMFQPLDISAKVRAGSQASCLGYPKMSSSPSAGGGRRKGASLDSPTRRFRPRPGNDISLAAMSHIALATCRRAGMAGLCAPSR